jgi:hypothetical protein
MPLYAGTLCIGVARFCDAVVQRRNTAHGEMLVFRGEKNDVLLARWIFGVLIDSIQKEQRKSGWTARGEANSFRVAAASTLSLRLKDLAAERVRMYQQAQQESGSRALVVVDRKALEVTKRFGAQKVRGSSRGFSSDGAHMAGTEAGKRINIPSGRPIGGSTAARIGGRS